MMTTMLVGNCGDGIAYPTELAVRGAGIEACNKSATPGLVSYSEAEAASEYAADASDPANQEHQQSSRKTDQRTADSCGDRCKVIHDITSRCCRRSYRGKLHPTYRDESVPATAELCVQGVAAIQPHLRKIAAPSGDCRKAMNSFAAAFGWAPGRVEAS